MTDSIQPLDIDAEATRAYWRTKIAGQVVAAMIASGDYDYDADREWLADRAIYQADILLKRLEETHGQG